MPRWHCSVVFHLEDPQPLQAVVEVCGARIAMQLFANEDSSSTWIDMRDISMLRSKHQRELEMTLFDGYSITMIAADDRQRKRIIDAIAREHEVTRQVALSHGRRTSKHGMDSTVQLSDLVDMSTHDVCEYFGVGDGMSEVSSVEITDSENDDGHAQSPADIRRIRSSLTAAPPPLVDPDRAHSNTRSRAILFPQLEIM